MTADAVPAPLQAASKRPPRRPWPDTAMRSLPDQEAAAMPAPDTADESRRLSALRRFLPRGLAEKVAAFGDDSLLESHRRELAVFFADLRGFTAFNEMAEPEDVMCLLEDFHGTVDELVERFEASVGDFAGDGVMAYFNDPLPVGDFAERAVRMEKMEAAFAFAVDGDAIALGHAQALEDVGEPADLGVELGIGDRPPVSRLRLPVVGDPLAPSRFDVAVEAVVGGVELAAHEPLGEGQVPVEDRVPFLEPVEQGRRLAGPEPLVVHVGLVVERRVDDERLLLELLRGGKLRSSR